MSIFTRDKVYLSADRQTYFQYNKGTGTASLVVDGTTVWSATSSTFTASIDIGLGAQIANNVSPDADDTYDLGGVGAEWKDLYVDGVAYLDAIDFNGTAIAATAAEINAVADVSARLVNLNATSLTLTATTHGERIITLSHTAAASTVTLPAATGTGNIYRFIVAAVNTNNHVIKVANGTDVFEGMAIMCNDSDNTVSGFESGATDDTITLNGTTTGGAAIGDYVEIIDYASGKFHIRAALTGTGSEATPFSATV